MTLADVAELLSRSKAWVSTRRNLLTEMTPAIRQMLFRGALPVYSYMVTLRPFMRMNDVTPQEIENFMQAVAGAKLSIREIELLAHGYFRGTSSLPGDRPGPLAVDPRSTAGGRGEVRGVESAGTQPAA